MMIFDFPSSDFSRKLSEKYGYDEFIIRRWERFFGREESEKLVEAMENIPKYIRVNTIKTDESGVIRRLENRGFRLRETDVRFCYEVIEEPYSIGATPEYLMGYYYIMDKSSCIPPLALNPGAREFVIDFAASPGGKTTMIAQIMGNRGKLLAIEGNRDRIPALIDNLHRMGVLNTAVLHMNSAEFHRLGMKADKILLDAPCTGEGIIHKDPSRKISRGVEDIKFCSSLQTRMLESAIKSIGKGGVIVYSTCSLTPEENELVINEMLKKHRIHLEEVEYGVPALTKIGGMKLDSELKKARRIYPHIHRCSGFFVAKIVKD
ncbi:NOL1/NOP2/sun family putative RNA methylase [Geoglobus acetivorans]|uniref:NOL1/NOP2/sun family putative RNA methylase n=1 Tax=Geoglobus acetivorans TaxID=565033 RepID=A0ABZ3H536_GEOAI|nr:NOL1/NOP2/sun family putative RNA methylase [Geoglobus acetivorans]